MRIEEVVWSLLEGRIRTNELDDYTLYFAYSTLYKLKRRFENMYKKYKDIGLGNYVKPIIDEVDKALKKLHPRIKGIDVCYAVEEASVEIANNVASETLRKLMLALYRKIMAKV